MSILHLLSTGNYIIVNKQILAEFGADAAIMMGELASTWTYWSEQGKLDEDGYFYATAEAIEEKTGLSYYLQNKAIERLKAAGFIGCAIKGLPARRFIRINESQVFDFFKNQFSKNSKTVIQKTSKLDLKNFETSINKESNKESNKEEERERARGNDLAAALGDLAPAFRNWLELWKETHGNGREMPWLKQEAQIRALLGMPENIRKDAIEKATWGGWKSIHDIREDLNGRRGSTDRQTYARGQFDNSQYPEPTREEDLNF